MEEECCFSDVSHMDAHENNSGSSNVERFSKRLEKYRTHSNDCKFRKDRTSDELQEQQNNEISLLQSKTKEPKKKKRSNRKGLMRNAEHSNIMKNQHPLCQSSQQPPTLPENISQCGMGYFRNIQFSQYNQLERQQQITQVPFINDVQIKQENQQLFYSPENEFHDLDFYGMAKLMNNQPVGLESLKFDEDCQQVPSFSLLHQYTHPQSFDDESRYKSIHLNPNYFP